MLDVTASWGEMLLRLGAAAICGGVLGWDREAHTKPAGFRTNILVSMGGALFAMLGMELSAEVRAAGGTNSDPVRVIGGIVGGVGFLGAATVIRGRHDVTLPTSPEAGSPHRSVFAPRKRAFRRQ
jgi:putative Mg2+ transporter-C (MgtC) family protein